MGGAAAAPKVSARPGWKSHWTEMQVLPTTFGEGSRPREPPLLRLGFGALPPACWGMPGRQRSLKAKPAQGSV